MEINFWNLTEKAARTPGAISTPLSMTRPVTVGTSHFSLNKVGVRTYLRMARISHFLAKFYGEVNITDIPQMAFVSEPIAGDPHHR